MVDTSILTVLYRILAVLYGPYCTVSTELCCMDCIVSYGPYRTMWTVSYHQPRIVACLFLFVSCCLTGCYVFACFNDHKASITCKQCDNCLLRMGKVTIVVQCISKCLCSKINHCKTFAAQWAYWALMGLCAVMYCGYKPMYESLKTLGMTSAFIPRLGTSRPPEGIRIMFTPWEHFELAKDWKLLHSSNCKWHGENWAAIYMLW